MEPFCSLRGGGGVFNPILLLQIKTCEGLEIVWANSPAHSLEENKLLSR